MVLKSVGLPAEDDAHPLEDVKWENNIITTTRGTDDEFKQELLNNSLVIVSDGSAKQNRATGAWIITSEALFHQGKYIEGFASSFGSDSIQDSHRAESIGLLGGMLLLSKKLQQWQVTTGSVLFGCDKISALRYMIVHDKYKYISANVPYFDILQFGRSLRLQGITYKFQHIKGHQNNYGQPLDFLATLNV